MSNKPTGLYTWEQILKAAGEANVRYGAWMPQQWIDYLNEALREMPSRPEPLSSDAARTLVARLVKYEDDRFDWTYNLPNNREMGEVLDSERAAISRLARQLLEAAK